MQTSKSPGGAGYADRGSRHLHRPFTKLPPYSKHLDQSRRSIAVLTGSGAWDRARSGTWFAGAMLVLPPGEDPAVYRWPVAGRDCIVFSFGDTEPRERLVRLSVLLVRAGAWFVIWATGENPSPIFRAKKIREAA